MADRSEGLADEPRPGVPCTITDEQVEEVVVATLTETPVQSRKVRDVVGLYLDPPEQAIVLCTDEKSQIQALNRSQPMMPGMPERRSHDYPGNP